MDGVAATRAIAEQEQVPEATRDRKYWKPSQAYLLVIQEKDQGKSLGVHLQAMITMNKTAVHTEFRGSCPLAGPQLAKRTKRTKRRGPGGRQGRAKTGRRPHYGQNARQPGCRSRKRPYTPTPPPCNPDCMLLSTKPRAYEKRMRH